jgi:hypothetical protein
MTTHTFSPGDRIRNTFTHGQYLGTIVDDPDTEQGTVALTYDFSSQIWYVDPVMLTLVSRGEDA